MRILVTGAGGFIGHHLTSYLIERGHDVRGVDLKQPEYERTRARDFRLLDLRRADACLEACAGIDEVYHLAANLGGLGVRRAPDAEIMRDNGLIDTHMLEAARRRGVRRFLFASSSSIYPRRTADGLRIREDDAYPAQPADGEGWQKLVGERLCRHYLDDFGMETRVARIHDVYGPLGAYEGGRAPLPAAICHRLALASDGDGLAVLGDGEQTGAYCYVDDCVEGLHRLMRSDWPHPLNLGHDESVTVNALIDLVAAVAGKRIDKRHDLSTPCDGFGRHGDHTRLLAVLGWTPSGRLRDGVARTYQWIAAQGTAAQGIVPSVGVTAEVAAPVYAERHAS